MAVKEQKQIITLRAMLLNDFMLTELHDPQISFNQIF